MSAALDLADPKTQWVQRVLGLDLASLLAKAPPETSPVETEKAEPEAPGFDADELAGRLNEAGVQINDHIELPEFAALDPRLDAGFAAIAAGDLAAAAQIADELATALARLMSAARAQAAGPKGGGLSLRTAALLGLAWRKVSARVPSEIAAVKDALRAALEADDELDPDEVDEIAGKLTALDEITGFLEDDLSPMLDRIVTLQGEARTQAVKELRDAVGKKRVYLLTDDWVTALPDVGVAQVSFVGDALAALDALDAALPA